MSYLDHLEQNLAAAEELLEQLRYCVEKDYWTAADLIKMHLNGVLKVSKFCCSCAKRKADKADIPYHEFKCVGGCVKGMSLDQWKDNNRRVIHVFKLFGKDQRYDKDGNFNGGKRAHD